jgi:hypothetical protein
VFIDEIDAIGRQRGAQDSGGEERDQTLNQVRLFLAERGRLEATALRPPELIVHFTGHPFPGWVGWLEDLIKYLLLGPRRTWL